MARRLLTTAALATAGVMAFAGPASAHDCLRLSANPTGLQKSAENGGKWFYVDLEQFLTADQLECVRETYSGPTQLAVGSGVAHDGVVAAKAAPKALTDGRGIDSFERSLLPAFDRCKIPLG